MIAAIRRKGPQASERAGQRLEAQQMAGLVRECQIAGIARQACAVYLSRLPPEDVKQHHIRLARAALEPLAHADRARLFALPNKDLVVIWRGPADLALAASRTAIAQLFTAEDWPNREQGAGAAGGFDCGSSEAAGIEPVSLWEEFDLPLEADRLLALVREPQSIPRAAPPPPATVLSPLDPPALALLERHLVQADVARFARRHPIGAIAPDGSFRLMWEKRTLCVAELGESLAPDYAPEADLWLFRRLTRTLDRRMLALLSAQGELAEAGPFAIDINVASILAPEFLRFDAALPAQLRGQVTLDLQPADILSDPAAFLFARDFARARGFRLLLQGVTAELMPMFPLGRLGLDLLQLRWSERLPAEGPWRGEESRIVLCEVDSAAAIEWGVGQGIALFEGTMVEDPKRRTGRTGARADARTDA